MGGQGLGSVLSAAVCKIHYIESLLLVLKDKRSCFSQSERSAVQLPLNSLQVGRLIPKPSSFHGVAEADCGCDWCMGVAVLQFFFFCIPS